MRRVFADHASSIVPIDVRTLLWDLRRRFVYFGTSVTSIFKGEEKSLALYCYALAFTQSRERPRLVAFVEKQFNVCWCSNRYVSRRDPVLLQEMICMCESIRSKYKATKASCS
ncbi:hypothetical protein M758_2G230300 [Ceratodon purpureus]|nr:hypothetical protein M758_2G230300 [Ceratodon purpureus]